MPEQPAAEVWITGAGVVSALGAGLGAHRRAMERAEHGLRPLHLFDGEPDPCLCGLVPAAVLSEDLEATAETRADALLGLALEECLAGAGLDAHTLSRAELHAGTTLGNMHAGSRYYRALRRGGHPDPTSLGGFLPGAVARRVARAHGLGGRAVSYSSACGAAAAAIGGAWLRLRHGLSGPGPLLAGGFEALSPFVVAGFASLQLLAAVQSKPFDAERDGLNPGEGATVVLLERAEEARARGAQPLGRLAGFGDALEAFHQTRAHPEGEGLLRAMERALAAAGAAPGDLDHLHLHGTGTRSNDASEHRALCRLLGERLPEVPACSTKPMTGHTFGASAALSLVFSLLLLDGAPLPATLGRTRPDPALGGLTLFQKPRAPDAPPQNALISALGFGGEAYALLLQGVER